MLKYDHACGGCLLDPQSGLGKSEEGWRGRAMERHPEHESALDS